MSQRLSRETGRQALLQILRWGHYAILVWGLLGWLIPSQVWLIAYLIVTPAIAIQWRFNRNTCVLNNLESWIRTGQWRDESDLEQGGFIAGVIERLFRRRPSPATVEWITYGLLVLFWTCAAIHLNWMR